MRFTAKVLNANEVAEVIETAKIKSENETLYIMSNGEEMVLIHTDYKEEYEKDGYFVAVVVEYGRVVSA